MKSLFRRASLWVAAAALAVMPSATVWAQGEVKPAVVVSFANIKEQLQDVNYIAGAVGQKDAASLVLLSANAYVKPFDQTKNFGAYVTLDGGEPKVVAFLPVKSMDDVVELIENNTGNAPEKDGDYYVFTNPSNPDMPLYALDQNGWAFLSNTKENLGDLPSDPAKLIDGLGAYNIGVRVNVKDIPEEMKQMAIGLMEQGFEQVIEEMEEENPDQAEMQRQMNAQSLEQMKKMMNELEVATFGLAIDKNAPGVYMEVKVEAAEGSDTAKQILASKGAYSSFRGFMLEESAMNFAAISKIAQGDIESSKAAIANIPAMALKQLEDEESISDEDRELIESSVQTLTEVLSATVESGKMDMGGALVLTEDTAAIVAGGHMMETKKFEDMVKKLVERVQQEAPPEVKIELDAVVKDGVTYHNITVPVPDEEAQKVFGEEVVISLGIGKDVVYLSAGKNADATLQDAIKNSKSKPMGTVPYMEMNMDLAKVMKFAADVQPDQLELAAIAGSMEGKPARAIMTGEIEGNTGKVKILIEESLLKALGSIGAMAGGAGGAEF